MLIEAPVLTQPESGTAYVVYSYASLNEKANVVADALSRKSSLFALRALNAHLALNADGFVLVELKTKPLFLQRIRELQSDDGTLLVIMKRNLVQDNLTAEYSIGDCEYHPDKANVVTDALSRKSMMEMRAKFARLSLASDGRLLAELQVKAQHEFPSMLLQPIAVPKWKWERIAMNFVSGLSLTPTKKDLVWVIIDQFSKGVHFLAMRINYSLQKLAELYITEIVRLHGVPDSIILDRDLRFTSRFSGNWERYFPLAEFTYNNSFQASIPMAPFEALYGKKCRTPLCWTELDEKRVVGPDLVHETNENVSPWKKVLRFGRKGKLSPRYVGPYVVIERIGSVAYHLKLSPELERIHDVLHVLMLQKYHSDPSHTMLIEEIEVQTDLTYEEKPFEILAREEKVYIIKGFCWLRFLAKSQNKRGFLGSRRCNEWSCMTRRNPEFIADFDPEIERTIRRLREQMNMALPRNYEVIPPIRNQNTNDPPLPQDAQIQNRTIRDFVVPVLDDLQSGVVRPAIQVGNFELKPVMFQMLNLNGQYAGLPHEDAREDLKSFLLICVSFSQQGVPDDALKMQLFLAGKSSYLVPWATC
ncbi:uncharacterized protein LOC128035477 [Gossypium raimondii]|uniref:uncharacterized protein LOC128035477 n=1 Tax=Gossypium raimondii TaxID=29730 RepID=UPI00227AAC1C|nr:uncharacterized protein LOC128035477 [Gossypium raimondii]